MSDELPACTSEHPAVQAAWKNLQNKTSYLSDKHRQRLEAAFRFGADAHKTQFRKSGEPYITHPLTVAAILADHHMDIATLCAGILHDTIEDTDVTAADLERHFGKTVTQLVEAVTKLDK
ncbi:MAG: HD domain-containing protein, partial [Geopsychrobacter sp.]|nr:HD domain-containing protein [Geopsychrobacter sp.]